MDNKKNAASPGSRGFEDAVEGEGSREADRRYRADTERFIASGGVEDAANEAKKALEEDGDALEAAEAEGRSHMAEEDPELRRKG